MARRVIISLVFAAFLPCENSGFAQTANADVTFEAASVKAAGPPVYGQIGRAMRGGPGTTDPGRITVPRATLAELLALAYDVMPEQVSGPAWIDDSASYVYRIDASLPPNTTREQLRRMLQNLLAERFHVKLHHETKNSAGYELVVASGGPKLKEWTPETSTPSGKPVVDANGFLKLPPGSGAGFVMPKGGGVIRMTYRDTMAVFCRGLGFDINLSMGMPPGSPRPRVIDKTGLTGTYEFTLEFAGSMGSPRMASDEPDASPAGDPEGAPDIFAAVERQLGLKLVKVKDMPLNLVIVDSADKVPTEN